MRKEARLLLERAIDSLLLAIEHFNRPWDRGRLEAVLMHLDHSFEMLLKAAIVHQGGRILERETGQTIGFDHCVRKCSSDAQVKCLTEDQALILRIINDLRDAVMHHIAIISEEDLYLQTQAGVTLFDDLLQTVFNRSLANLLPERVLPISTKPPRDLQVLFDDEFSQIRELIAPGKRRRAEAKARLRPLAIMEFNVQGERRQPTDRELDHLIQDLGQSSDWRLLFPGIGSLNLDREGHGLTFSLRITRQEGLPVRKATEGDRLEDILAYREVNPLDRYSMNLTQLRGHLGFTQPKALALIRHLGLQDDEECYKEFKLGASQFKRYSPKALQMMREALERVDMQEIWQQYRKALCPGPRQNL